MVLVTVVGGSGCSKGGLVVCEQSWMTGTEALVELLFVYFGQWDASNVFSVI